MLREPSAERPIFVNGWSTLRDLSQLKVPWPRAALARTVGTLPGRTAYRVPHIADLPSDAKKA